MHKEPKVVKDHHQQEHKDPRVLKEHKDLRRLGLRDQLVPQVLKVVKDHHHKELKVPKDQ